MPVVCDFTQLVGDAPNTIAAAEPAIEFNTGGREAGQTAFLLFNVRRLTDPETSVSVRVNGDIVGSIFPCTPEVHNCWQAQMIALAGSTLNNGNNTLTFDGTGFQIKNMVCFFHQSA